MHYVFAVVISTLIPGKGGFRKTKATVIKIMKKIYMYKLPAILFSLLFLLSGCEHAFSSGVITKGEESPSFSETKTFISSIFSEDRPISESSSSKARSSAPLSFSSPYSSSQNSSAQSSASKESPSKDNTDEKIKKMISEMNLEEKICQLFVITPEALKNSSSPAKEADEKILSGLKSHPVGGVIFFSNNLTDPKNTTDFIRDLQNSSKIPLFVAIDEEGGTVARIANNSKFGERKFPPMLEVGKSGKAEDAYTVGAVIGGYLSKYGFNLDFAPVADIYSNPQNKVIGQRAFAKDAETVSRLSGAMAQGLEDQQIVPCFKHFPGHGDTLADSHNGKVIVNKTWEELKSFELLPFISAINNDCDMIMLAHIDLPNILSDGLPSSLSKELITDKLRGELGYNGVVITDALRMKAISERFPAGKSAVLALQAGADLLLLPENFEEAFHAIKEALQKEELSEERIDESLERILLLKAKYNIITL